MVISREVVMHKITNDDIALINAYMKHKSKGWVKNRLHGRFFDKIPGDKFAVIIPEFNQNECIVKGAYTWGRSGFTFNIVIKLSGNYIPSIRINPHPKCEYSQDDLNNIVYELIHTAKHKLAGSETKERADFREPRLQAQSKSVRISQKSRDNINKFKGNYFNVEFADFLLQHEQDGLRCQASRKSSR